MSLETGLVSELQNAPQIAGLIGTRVYPLVVPQDATLPAIAYQLITGRGIIAHDGPTSLSNKRIQLACVGSTYAAAADLANTVAAHFRGFKGQLGTGGPQVEFGEDANQVDGRPDENPSGYVRYLDITFLAINGG